MPNDVAELVIALALLTLLAVALGTLTARLFMAATYGAQDGTKGP
jgi:hypothetical protein